MWTGGKVTGGTHTWIDRSSAEYLRDEVELSQVKCYDKLSNVCMPLFASTGPVLGRC